MSSEKSSISYGVLVTFFLIVLVILSLVTIFSKRRREVLLKQKIESVFSDEQKEKWTLGSAQKINVPMGVDSACFRLNGSPEKNAYAFVIRVQTLYGPYPAVFVYEEGQGVSFVGVINLNGRVRSLVLETDASIQYWIRQLPYMVTRK